MLKRLKVNLHKPYISDPLERKTLKESLSMDIGVVYNLYLLKNGLKELNRFAELKVPNYELVAHVRVNYAFIGSAKTQVWGVKTFAKLLKRKPAYTIFCALNSLVENKIVYYCRHTTRKQEVIYDLIEDSYSKIQNLIPVLQETNTI